MEIFSALFAFFVRGIHRSPVNSATKASDAELWYFFICAWINGWVNNHGAGDLRHHRAHYAVTVKAVLTHLGRDMKDAVSQTTFSSAFLLIKILEFRLKFHWILFFKFPINSIPLLVNIIARHRPCEPMKPSAEPMMVNLPTHIWVIRC